MALSDLLKRVQELQAKKVQVGWFESSQYSDGTPVAEVAIMQEFGTKTAPARPFMRPTVANEKSNWADKIAPDVKNVVNGSESVSDLYTKAGVIIEGDVVHTIASITSPPLTDTTLLLRKWRQEGRKITGATVGEAHAALNSDNPPSLSTNTKPLNDTGYMVATLTHEIVKS